MKKKGTRLEEMKRAVRKNLCFFLALSFDRINFFNMTHLHFDFTFIGQRLKCAIVVVSQ